MYKWNNLLRTKTSKAIAKKEKNCKFNTRTSKAIAQKEKSCKFNT